MRELGRHAPVGPISYLPPGGSGLSVHRRQNIKTGNRNLTPRKGRPMNATNGNRRSRQRLATLSATTLLCGALASYGAQGPGAWASSTPPEQLTLAIARTGTQAAGAPPLLAIYIKENPQVHWNLVENVTEEKLLAEEAAGDAPSAAMLDTTNLVATMATSDAILPLQPLITASKLNMSQFTEASLYSNTYLGAQYAPRFFEDTYALYYNKTLFKRAGIASPPVTLSQLVAEAVKLSITGSNGQSRSWDLSRRCQKSWRVTCSAGTGPAPLAR